MCAKAVKKNFPVYCVTGEDEYERKEEVDKVLSGLITADEKENSLRRLSASEIRDEHIAEMRSMSFFSSKQVFLIAGVNKIKKQASELLSAYLENPHDGTFLILEGTSIDGRSSLAKRIKSIGKLVQFKKPRNPDMRTEAMRLLKRQNRTIEPDALDLLAERVGGSSSFLSVAVNRLVMSVGKDQVISLALVRDVVEKSTSYDFFALADAIGARQTEKTFKIMGALFDQGINELELIGSLCWFLGRLYTGRRMLEKGAPAAVIKQELKINFYFDKYMMQVRNFTKKELTEFIDELYKIDLGIKQGLAQGRPEIEFLLTSLLSGKLV